MATANNINGPRRVDVIPIGGGNVRYIDPNPLNEGVKHEDLIVYVNLKARTKSRSIITSTEDNELELDSQSINVRGETNYTFPTGSNYLTTNWTKIGGGTLQGGEDVEGFGITNIDIEFKSSFMPKIVIDFVDIRGATLFEQGPCSPYASFLHLPYPVFELTIKGYYGKPVKYTLALVKFNTKFNAETGNFESRAEFVGYTYAFLADIPMGYVMASSYMPGSDTILAKKWKLIREKTRDQFGGLPEEPIRLQELIRRIKRLENLQQTAANSKQLLELSKISKLRQRLSRIISLSSEFLIAMAQDEADNNRSRRGVTIIPSEWNGRSSKIELRVVDGITQGRYGQSYQALRDQADLYLGDDTSSLEGIIGAEVTTYNTLVEEENFGDEYKLPSEEEFANLIRRYNTGIWPRDVGRKEDGDVIFDMDIGKGISEPVSKVQEKLTQLFDSKRKITQELLNEAVRDDEQGLGFNPSIKNIMAVILANVEVFIELMIVTSEIAEINHLTEDSDTLFDADRNITSNKNNRFKDKKSNTSTTTNEDSNKAKIYPWPTYWETSREFEGGVGQKERYPGVRTEFLVWDEVIFVEDFLKALGDLREELETITGDVEERPGFDNYRPLTLFETQFVGGGVAPNRWWRVDRDGPGRGILRETYNRMVKSAFLLGDYSMLNSLTVLKSQLGLDYNWDGINNLPLSFKEGTITENVLKTRPISRGITDGSLSNKLQSSKTNVAKMSYMGRVDALNYLTTVKDSAVLSFVKKDLEQHNTGNDEIPAVIEAGRNLFEDGIGDFDDILPNVTSKDFVTWASDEIGDSSLFTTQLNYNSATAAPNSFNINGAPNVLLRDNYVQNDITLGNDNLIGELQEDSIVFSHDGPIQFGETTINANPNDNQEAIRLIDEREWNTITTNRTITIAGDDSGDDSKSGVNLFTEFNRWYGQISDRPLKRSEIGRNFGYLQNALAVIPNYKMKKELEGEDEFLAIESFEVKDSKNWPYGVSESSGLFWLDKTHELRVKKSGIPSNGWFDSAGDKNFALSQEETVGQTRTNSSTGRGQYSKQYNKNIFEGDGPQLWYMLNVFGVLNVKGENLTRRKKLVPLDFGWPQNINNAPNPTSNYNYGTSTKTVDKSTWDPLVMTPLWIHNYRLGKRNRFPFFGNVDRIIDGQEGLNGHPLAERWFPLGYLFALHQGSNATNTGFKVPFDNSINSPLTSLNAIYGLTDPKKSSMLAWGAILWRMKEAGHLIWEADKYDLDELRPSVTISDFTGWNGTDPVWFDLESLGPITVSYPQAEVVDYLDVEKRSITFLNCTALQVPVLNPETTIENERMKNIVYISKEFENDSITSGDNNVPQRRLNYPNVTSIMKEFALMPVDFKVELINKFERWVVTTFSNNILPKIDPLNFPEDSLPDKANAMSDFYGALTTSVEVGGQAFESFIYSPVRGGWVSEWSPG